MAEAAGCIPFETGRGVHLKPEPAPLTASWAHGVYEKLVVGAQCEGLGTLGVNMPLPNGSRLSCGRRARRRNWQWTKSGPRQGHNTPLPLRRSPPVSFKRLLGSAPLATVWLGS